MLCRDGQRRLRRTKNDQYEKCGRSAARANAAGDPRGRGDRGRTHADRRCFWGTFRETMKEVQTSAADKARTSLHQEIDFNVGAAKVYEALLDSKQFGMATGCPAEIDPQGRGSVQDFRGIDRRAKCGTGFERENCSGLAARSLGSGCLFDSQVRAEIKGNWISGDSGSHRFSGGRLRLASTKDGRRGIGIRSRNFLLRKSASAEFLQSCITLGSGFDDVSGLPRGEEPRNGASP